jgi:hypothetical protein
MANFCVRLTGPAIPEFSECRNKVLMVDDKRCTLNITECWLDSPLRSRYIQARVQACLVLLQRNDFSFL